MGCAVNCCDDFGNCRQGRDCPLRCRPRQPCDKQQDSYMPFNLLNDLLLALVLAVAILGLVSLFFI